MQVLVLFGVSFGWKEKSASSLPSITRGCLPFCLVSVLDYSKH